METQALNGGATRLDGESVWDRVGSGVLAAFEGPRVVSRARRAWRPW